MTCMRPTMTRDKTPQRYGKLSITLHWLMLALFVGVYVCIEIKGLLPRGGHFEELCFSAYTACSA